MGVRRTIKKSSSKAIVTIGEAFASFENEKHAKGVVEATMRNYRQGLSYLKKHAGFSDETDIRAITRELMVGWINTMRDSELSASSINHYLRDCRAFIYWCMEDDRKYLEPFRIEQVRAQEPKKKTYSKEDLRLLLAKPREKDDMDFVEWRNWAIVNLVYDMGARCGTLLEIQIRDVNLQKKSIYLRHTKNKSLSHMVISSACAKVIKEYMEDWRAGANEEDYLFCNYSNEQLTYNALAHSFTLYCKARGVERHSLHGIRHSFATELAENTNGDMVRVQKALGHSSIDMARKYIDMANIDMGAYDEISPLAKSKDNRGSPKRKIKRK